MSRRDLENWLITDNLKHAVFIKSIGQSFNKKITKMLDKEQQS